MNKMAVCLLWLITSVSCFADTFVAVVETIAENNAIGRSERLFLTDKLRESAKKALPAYMGYVIMTRENIQQMLPPGKSIEDCEGECLVETGKNINAHYIAQARVGKFGKNFTLTVEFYETMGNNLVGSFTARTPDADGLLEEIERQASGMFAAISGGRPIDYAGESDGFSELNLGQGGYKVSGVRNHIVSVVSNPAGAVFSVDGRPVGSCSKTPCDVILSEGSHRFIFGMDLYYDKDTVVDVNAASKNLAVKLTPNFGSLLLSPQLQDGVGSENEFMFEIDGNRTTDKQLRLPTGKHSVSIFHRCYETASFNVSIKNGSELKFDHALQPLLGGIDLKAVEKGMPKAVSVFINGIDVGKTPFLDAIPICSKIAVGDERDIVTIEMKKNETVTYIHDLDVLVSEKVLLDERDGNKYKTVRIGKQVWMAENLNFPTSDSWCYEKELTNCQMYGRLYNWSSAKKACPSGWHLPSNEEWNKLWYVLGSEKVAGKKLKAKNGWSKKGNGDGLFDFSVLPAGYRNAEGYFGYIGGFSFLWSSSEYDERNAYALRFGYSNTFVLQHHNGKNYGFSVRCVEDEM